MKFELTSPGKQYSDSELLDDLKLVAKRLGKKSLKLRDYSVKNGAKFSNQTLKKRFGSWEQVLFKAGLQTEKSVHGIEYGESSINENLLIEDVKSVAKKIDNPALTLEDYIKFGKYSASAVCKRFGGWNKAKEKSGLDIGRKYNSSEDEYFQNLEEVWQKLRRQPKYHEMIKPLSKFHISSYENKFGSWRETLERFIEYINSSNIEKEFLGPKSIENIQVQEIYIPSNVAKLPKRLTTRSINWRIRFVVMKRDNFRCKSCGRSPATDQTVVLHVDHIKAWANGGETVLENLQTLCSVCNIGKSDLE
jgi:Homing endonuclease associated repeat/HNH endonuclease